MSELVLGAAAMKLAASNNAYTCFGEFFGGFEVEGMCVSEGQFDQSFFNDITFDKCDFSNASFDKAVLVNVSFIDCDLSGADFSSAELEEVSFMECDLSRTSFESGTLKGFTVTDSFGGMEFCDAEVSAGIFYNSELGGSNLYDASVSDTTFCACNLSRVFLSKNTTFKEVRIVNCDITELALAMVKGGYELLECKYRPYVEITNGKKVTLQLVGRGETTKHVPPKKYGYGYDPKAFIYCSDLEEYESVL